MAKLLEGERYEDTEILANEILAKEPDNRAALLARVAALYWQQKNGQVLAELDSLLKRNTITLTPDELAELDLFAVVSLFRLGDPMWKDVAQDLYNTHPFGPIHDRLYQFLAVTAALDELPDPLRLVADAFAAHARGEHTLAATMLMSYFEEYFRYNDSVDGLLQAAQLVFQVSDVEISGATIFKRITDDVTAFPTPQNQRLRILNEYTGKLYRAGREYSQAVTYFRRGVASAEDPFQQDRMRWYLVDSLSELSIDHALDEFTADGVSWSDTDLLDDAVERLIPRIMQSRRYTDLLRLRSALQGTVAHRSAARIDFIVAALVQSGILRDDGVSVSTLLEGVVTDGELYYAFLAATALERDVAFLFPDSGDEAAHETEGNEIIEGYLNYGLVGQAREAALPDIDTVSPSLIRAIASRLNEAGDYLEALRLMGALTRRDGYRMTRADYEQSHPQAFLQAVLSAANQNKLPVHVLYGMVRTESFFSPDIVSRAGAVGLSQLMPETAAEVADRLRVPEADLTDPATNLLFGSWYLAHLAGRTSSLFDAVSAYNAGITRVRSWRRGITGLPDELFLESIPIYETRTHDMKVLTSSCIYGYLYFGTPVSRTVRRYFSNFGFSVQ